MFLIIILNKTVAGCGTIFIEEITKKIKEIPFEKAREIARYINKFINKHRNFFEKITYEII
jgi:hypothetical protein